MPRLVDTIIVTEDGSLQVPMNQGRVRAILRDGSIPEEMFLNGERVRPTDILVDQLHLRNTLNYSETEGES